MILASGPHRLFLVAPIPPLNYPYIAAIHLVSGDLWGCNDKKKKTHEKRNVAYIHFFALFKKASFWLWPGQKRKKKTYFCVMFNNQ